MKKTLPLYLDGYVTDYLVARPHTEPFIAPYSLPDQLRFEKEMRDIYYERAAVEPERPILGKTSAIGTPWEYYTDNKNPYVDFSKFYFTLTRVTFLAATTLVSDRARSLPVRVWSYAAFDMWCGGKRVATEKVPVYAPIRYTDLVLELSEGENDIFLCVQNLGVRDTRNMISLQILDPEGIGVTLPIDKGKLDVLSRASDWFFDLRVRGSKLISGKADFDATVKLRDGELTLRRGECECEIGDSFSVTVEAKVLGEHFKRCFERFEYRTPVFKKYEEGAVEDVMRAVVEKEGYHELTSVEFYNKIASHGAAYTTYNYIMLSGGEVDARAEEELGYVIDGVRERGDCSDFSLILLLTLRRRGKLSEALCEKLRETALDFRYWMDEEGADAMCFWSENHALTFFISALVAGEDYPDEYFHRSKRSGREQAEVARRRIREWFDVIGTEGFEEFCAGGYMGVTVAALLAVYRFGGEEFRAAAKATIDRIFRESAEQCFDGIHLAPMGRVYRGSITPYVSAVQSLLYLLSDENAFCTDTRASTFVGSDYRIPTEYKELCTAELDIVKNSGSAEIKTRKRREYMLTSVASPRADEPPMAENRDTEYYRTKIMNEGFHGTSLFKPGGQGYQQHLWYAAISNRFFTFVTLPGSERDFCSMRPGYWYGNLVFPSVKQEGRELWCHYDIPDSVPTKFTHAYFPEYAADEVRHEGGFRFARVGDGYLALWCSEPLTLWENDAVVGADLRAYGSHTDWYIRVGSATEDGDFDSFIKSTLNAKTAI